MAKYKITCKECGKEHTVELFGKNKDRQRKLKDMDSCINVSGPCTMESEDNIMVNQK